MKSTVVIPNYNGREYLRTCLESLMICEKEPFKIIVVDNGSSDGSLEMMKESFDQVECISLPNNVGFAPAVNIGINAASTEFVILLNNDTKVLEGFVSKLEEALTKDSRIFSASAKMVDMNSPELLDGTGDYLCALGWAFADGKGKNTKDYGLSKKKIFSSCGGAAIYRRDVLNKLGAFDENHFAYLEDVDLGYRAKIYGYRNVYEPDAICLHAGSGFSGSRYNEFKVKLSSRNNVYMVLKNMPIIQLIINLPFLILGHLVKILFFIKKGLGKVYILGMLEGIKLFFSKEGFSHKVKFSYKNIVNYFKIQLELWWNIIRRFC